MGFVYSAPKSGICYNQIAVVNQLNKYYINSLYYYVVSPHGVYQKMSKSRHATNYFTFILSLVNVESTYCF